MKKLCHIAVFLCVAASQLAGFQACAAEVTVENQMVQSGLFAKANCKPNGVEGFNECACLADVHTPVIQGMTDVEKQKKLNALFSEAANKQKCEGVESQSESSKDEPASSTYNFDVTHQSSGLLGLRYESWAYTGGAHGNGLVEGMVIDLQQGKIIPLAEIFAADKLLALNTFIHDALSAEPEGEVFHDSIEGFKGVFITPAECKSCAVVLSDEGVKVVFQTYAVASFANGPMEVLVPEQFISHAGIKSALKNVKPQPTTPSLESK